MPDKWNKNPAFFVEDIDTTACENTPEVVSLLSLLQGTADDHVRSSAFSDLYERYRPLTEHLVFAFAVSAQKMVYVDKHELEEEACIALYRAAMTYKEGHHSTFGHYAKVCIRNRLISFLRHHRRSSAVSSIESIDVAYDHAVDPEDTVVSRDDFRASMDRFLGELTSYEHKVFDLYIRGHSYDVIAKALDVSKKSVDNAIYRIRAKLKQQFHM